MPRRGLTEDLARDGATTGSALGLYLQQRVGTCSHGRQTPDFGTFDYDERGELIIPLLRPQATRDPLPAQARPRRGASALATIGAIAAATLLANQLGGDVEQPTADAPSRSSSSSTIGALATGTLFVNVSGGAERPRVVSSESLGDAIARTNSFVRVGELHVQARQITCAEYDRYLAILEPAARAVDVPRMPNGTAAQPVAWVTFDAATRFCRAIDARLASAAEWDRIDAAGAHERGPLREWTATTRDDLVLVRGAPASMTSGERTRVLRTPLWKVRMGSAREVSAEDIGFRCVR